MSAAEPAGHAALTELLSKLGATVESGKTPSAKALCLVTPIGDDATTCAVEQGLDPKRTVAVDTLFPMAKRRTIMGTPITESAYRDAAHGLLASDGVPVTVCRDSPGFIAQRIVAMIVNIGCSIAQSRTATPADIDKAVTLGLNYPNGPFKFADVLGVAAHPPRSDRDVSHLRRPALPSQYLAHAPRETRRFGSYQRTVTFTGRNSHARRVHFRW